VNQLLLVFSAFVSLLVVMKTNIRRLISDKRGNAAVILSLVGTCVGLAALIIIFTIVPMIGYQTETSISMPASGPGSEWNPLVNTAMVNGSMLWQSTGGLIKLVAIVSILSMVIMSVMSMVVLQGRSDGGRFSLRLFIEDKIYKLRNNRFISDKRGNVAVMMGLVTVCIGIAALIIIFTVVPMIGYSTTSAMPALPVDSAWNSTHNLNLVNGSSLWVATGGLIKLVAIIAILSMVIMSVLSMVVLRQR
jgi:hypothetical protein